MRIQCPENLRVPPQGSSTEGESGPKARPKGVVDGKQVNIPVLYFHESRGTEEVGLAGCWMPVEVVEVTELEEKLVLAKLRVRLPMGKKQGSNPTP